MDLAITGSEEELPEILRINQTPEARLFPVTRSLRTVLFVATVLCTDLAGNIALRAGMRSSMALAVESPATYLYALLNPWVMSGVMLLIVGLGAQLALLSWADLTYVAPVTSIGYVLSALAGKLFLHEPLSPQRWIAIFLITAGVTLVSRTPLSTAGQRGGHT